MAPIADQLLRELQIDRQYKVEFAWGGNLTQLVDSNGNRVASISSTGTPNPSFPNTKIIDGQEWHYDPTVDLANNFFQQGAGLTTIDLGSIMPINQLVIYQHPFLPNMRSFHIQVSTDNIIFSTVVIQSAEITKGVFDFATVMARYIQITPILLSTDGFQRICELQIFNWIDETKFLAFENGEPDITITSKIDSTQNAIPTPSELQITLENIENRFSTANPLSPIYGILQPDGTGSGIKSGVPVRITVSASDSLGNVFSTTPAYYGFIFSDDNPGGTLGITYDDLSGTVMFLCKSLLSRFSQEISTPVYEGANVGYIVKDVAYRCGIADQDIVTNGMNQGVPYVGFNTETGLSILGQISQGLPFLRAFETYGPPWAKINFTNYGRSRTDINTANFWSSGALRSSGVLYVASVNSLFIIQGGDTIWKWDLSKPLSDGFTLYGTMPGGFSAPSFFNVFGNLIYLRSSNTGTFYHFDASAATFSLVTDGVPTTTTVFAVAMFDKYIYILGAGAPTSFNIYVWDTTTAIGTIVNKGNQTYTANSPTLTNNEIAADGTYLLFRSNTIGVMIWKHNGTPLTTPLTGVVQVNMFTGSTIGGENYTNVAFFFDSREILWAVVSVLKISGLRRIEVWSLDINVAFPSPSTTGTKQGTIKDNTSALAQISTFGVTSASFVLNGTYLYFVDSENNIYVWDTNKAFSNLFLISVGDQAILFPMMITKQASQLGFVNSFGPIVNSIDATNRLWYQIIATSLGSFPADFVGFTVQNILQFPLVPSVNFDINDGNTINNQISYGAPIGNRIVLTPNLFVEQSPSTVWQSSSEGLYFPSNQKTTQTLPLSGLSIRSKEHNQRFISIGKNNTSVFDDPTAVTNVLFSNGSTYPVTFFAYGDIGYLTIDATGLPALTTTGDTITGMTISQPGNNGIAIDVLDSVSFRMYKKKYVFSSDSPFFNDPSFYQDLLLAFKFQRPYVQALDLPWYPIAILSEAIGITNSFRGLNNVLFELTEFVIKGYKTSIKAKQYLSSFNI